MTLRRTVVPVGMGLILALGFGCGGPSGEGAANIKTYKVTGTVTFQGRPTENALITFVPASGRPAYCTSDANGNFSPVTAGAKSGIAEGEYRVTIVVPKSSSTPVAIVRAKEGEPLPADYTPPDPNAAPPATTGPDTLLPAKYADVNMSGLTASIKAGSNPPLKFDLVP